MREGGECKEEKQSNESNDCHFRTDGRRGNPSRTRFNHGSGCCTSEISIIALWGVCEGVALENVGIESSVIYSIIIFIIIINSIISSLRKSCTAESLLNH